MSTSARDLIKANIQSRTTFLDLGNCSLHSIPSELAQCTWLKRISFASGFFSSIASGHHDSSYEYGTPWSMQGYLPWIDSPNTGQPNTFRSLPSFFSQMRQLEEIILSDLPELRDCSILGHLNGLKRIFINGTGVRDLGALRKHILNGLHVYPQISGTENGIYVGGCNLLSPPLEILRHGHEAISNYFHEVDSQGTSKLFEAKLLLVGEPHSGKTSLLRRLYQSHLPLPLESEFTHGIDIHQHVFQTASGDQFRLNVWDFGGQEIYHATHQFFLTKRSLYVLLDDTRTNDKFLHDRNFKYWLEVIDLLSDRSPIIIFQNQKAKSTKGIDFPKMRERYPNIKELHGGDLSDKNSVRGIAKAIEVQAQELPHIGEELPAKWVDIRMSLERLALDHSYIKVEEYYAVYVNHLELDFDKALHLSRYLHDLGVFLHFQDDLLLTRYVILRNSWATTAVYGILDDEEIKSKFGRFGQRDLDRIWKGKEHKKMHPELMALLQKFELCYKLPDRKEPEWLATQLLQTSCPAELLDWETSGDLLMHYKYTFLPKGMMSRLIVRMSRLLPNDKQAWSNGALFQKGESHLLAQVSITGDVISLRARGVEARDLLGAISNDLDALNESVFGEQDAVHKFVPCNCAQCLQSKQPHLYEYKALQKRQVDNKATVECPSSYENVEVIRLITWGLFPTRSEVSSTSRTLSTPKSPEPPSPEPERIPKRIAILYSKHDLAHLNTLIQHLSGLRGKHITWSDKEIIPGDRWNSRIRETLSEVDIVLYLVSANSLATEFIHKQELPLVEKRCLEGTCVLIPIILDFCLWEEMPFADHNVLPMKGVPILDSNGWASANAGWVDVIRGIRKHLSPPSL